jgi:hypothetical protein
MSEEAVVEGRRSGGEMARLAGLYAGSGMGRRAFCSLYGMGLSTLSRHLRQLRQGSGEVRSDGGGRGEVRSSRAIDGVGGCALVEVERGAAVVAAGAEQARALRVELQHGRSVSVGRGFDAETLRRLVDVLERL